MLFNSVTFILLHFLCVALYWASPWQRVRQIILLIGSLVFYGWLYWPALFLLGAVIVVNYGFSLWIDSTQNKRQVTAFAVAVNLCNLGWFKYSSFLGETLAQILNGVGIMVEIPAGSLWLPLGISFFTFQVIGYLVDISRGEIRAERDFLLFSVFKCFYGQLVAGPIVRAKEFFPQLQEPRKFRADDFQLGIYLLIAGLAMKICLADTLSQFVDFGFSDPSKLEVATAWLTLYAFSAQILSDFWGYSTVAIGLGLMYGITLPLNFNLPYLATSLREFWHRWHITLSIWLRDYLYIPLGGNRTGRYRNLFLTMLLGGLWHGASWNYVLWGACHGAWLVLERVVPEFFPKGRFFTVVKWLLVVNGVCLLWVFFRSPNIDITIKYFAALFSPPYTMKNSPPDDLILILIGFVAFTAILGKSLTDRRFLGWGLAKQVGGTFFLLVLILAYADARLDFIYFVF